MNALAPTSPENVAETHGGVLPLTMKTIIKIGAQLLDVTYVDLISPRRHASLVRARSIIMYAMRAVTPRSYPEIAAAFGGRDHSCALDAVRKIEAQIECDVELRQTVEAFLAVLRKSAADVNTSDPDPYATAHRVVSHPNHAVNVSVECIRAFAAIVVAAEREALRQSRTHGPDNESLRAQVKLMQARLKAANDLLEMEAQMRRFVRAGMALRIARAHGTFEDAFIDYERQTEALLQAAHRHFSSRKEPK